MTPTAETGDLFDRLGRGEAAAWAQFDRLHRSWLMSRVERASQVRNWFWLTDPEDLVQEALTLFATRLRQGRFAFRGDLELRGYLLRTAFFVAMRMKRSARLRTRPLGEADSAEHRAAVQSVDWVAAAWRESSRYRCLELLMAAATALGPARRAVIELTLQGFRTGAIASRLGKSAGAVSCLKFNALKALREELERTRFLESCGEVLELP